MKFLHASYIVYILLFLLNIQYLYKLLSNHLLEIGTHLPPGAWGTLQQTQQNT